MANVLRCDRCKTIHDAVLMRDVTAARWDPEQWEPEPVNWLIVWIRDWHANNTNTVEYALCPYCKVELFSFMALEAVSGREDNSEQRLVDHE